MSSLNCLTDTCLLISRPRYKGSAPCFMVLPKEEKDVDAKRERDMEDHVPTVDLISRINNVQVSSNYPISAFVNFFDILIYFQPGFIGKRRGATPCRLGRTKRGSTTGGKGIKQKSYQFSKAKPISFVFIRSWKWRRGLVGLNRSVCRG